MDLSNDTHLEDMSGFSLSVLNIIRTWVGILVVTEINVRTADTIIGKHKSPFTNQSTPAQLTGSSHSVPFKQINSRDLFC